MRNHYIKAWRIFRGLTQKQLVERMEIEPGVSLISHNSLSRIERGEQPYSQPILEAAAKALDVTPAALLEVNPNAEGEVIDLMPLLSGTDPEKRKTIIAMVRAAVGA